MFAVVPSGLPMPEPQLRYYPMGLRLPQNKDALLRDVADGSKTSIARALLTRGSGLQCRPPNAKTIMCLISSLASYTGV